MNPQLFLVLGLLGVCVALFIANKPRMDVVALLAMTALPLTGVLSMPEALAGFSDPNVILIAALFVLSYFRRVPADKRRLNVSLALLMAGIIGNMIDRIRLGEVVDFIELHWRDLYSWPTFNIADSAICVGAVLLALEMLREEKTARARSSGSTGGTTGAAAGISTPAPEETSVGSPEN